MARVELTEEQEEAGVIWYYDHIREERFAFYEDQGFTQPAWEELGPEQQKGFRDKLRDLVVVLNAAGG